MASILSPEGRDPCGYVTMPPSVVVKVTKTTRNDFNGLLGIVVSFNVERERYLVHMTKSQSTMALKQENLVRVSFVESYRAQWEQLRNDARVREKMGKYLNLCRRYVAPMTLSQVVTGAVTLFSLLIYFVGFINTFMTVSLIGMIGIIAGPDLTSGPQVVVQNFPERARAAMEKQIPFLRGRLTNRVAVGVIILLLALCLQSLFLNGIVKMESPRLSPTTTLETPLIDKAMLEWYYSLGYEDAAKGRQHGSTLTMELDDLKIPEKKENAMMEELKNGVFVEPSKDKGQSILYKMTSLTNIGSILYLYRSIIDLGTDQSTKLFSVGQLAANIQHYTEWWRKALLALSLYNVLRVFL